MVSGDLSLTAPKELNAVHPGVQIRHDHGERTVAGQGFQSWFGADCRAKVEPLAELPLKRFEDVGIVIHAEDGIGWLIRPAARLPAGIRRLILLIGDIRDVGDHLSASEQ